MVSGAGDLGGGLALRQVLRRAPFGGRLYLSQIYGATCALGKATVLICEGQSAPTANEVKRIFEETLRRKAREHQKRGPVVPAPPATPSPAARLQQWAGLREDNLISQVEFERKRAEILAQF